MSTDQVQPTGKKNFSAKTRQEAMRLLDEEKLTMKQVATHIGCSITTLQNWKSLQKPKRSSSVSAKKTGSTVPPTSKKIKPSTSRKGFSSKAKKEALRLLFEENFSQRQTAEKIGCSLNTIKTWKAKHLKSKRVSSPVPKQTLKTTTPQRQPKDNKTAGVKELPVAFDDFVRNYWNEGTRAVDVLLLPHPIGPDVVRYVNEALRYAYDRLCQ